MFIKTRKYLCNRLTKFLMLTGGIVICYAAMPFVAVQAAEIAVEAPSEVPDGVLNEAPSTVSDEVPSDSAAAEILIAQATTGTATPNTETLISGTGATQELADTTAMAEATEIPLSEIPLTETSETDNSITLAEDPNAIWLGWTFYESGTKTWELAGGDNGRAFGRYQFDASSSLAPFLEYCLDQNAAQYGSFENHITKKGSNEVRSLKNLQVTWKEVCQQNDAEFFQLQTNFAMDYYYLPVKQRLLELYNINLDDYSAVLRGTVWSVAVRDGRSVSLTRKYNCLRSVTDSYTEILATDDVVDETKWLNRIYDLEAKRHPQQQKRWNTNQRNFALETLELLKQSTVDPTAEHSEYEIIQLNTETNTYARPAVLFEILFISSTEEQNVIV